MTEPNHPPNSTPADESSPVFITPLPSGAVEQSVTDQISDTFGAPDHIEASIVKADEETSSAIVTPSAVVEAPAPITVPTAPLTVSGIQPPTESTLLTRKVSGAAWPAILACCPAFLLLGVGMAQMNSPLPQPLTKQISTTNEDITADSEVLPVSQTMVVTPRPLAGFALLRGQLQPSGVVIGRAPISGQVSRVYVRTGQHVNVSDAVIELSSGGESRPAVGAERQQNAAEAAQVAAANNQATLQHQMRSAQAQLVEAELRVRAARRRVENAQSIIRRLRAGEEVSVDDSIPEPPQPEPAPATPRRSSGRSAASDKAAAEHRSTLQNAQKAQDAAAAARDRAKAAFAAASKAEADVQSAKKKLQAAQDNAAEVQKKFDATEAKGSDVQAARDAIEDASGNVDEANARATKARQEADRLDSLADAADADAKKASGKVAQALQKMQVFADSGSEPAAAPTTPPARETRRTSGGGGRLTVSAAVKLAQNAMAESDAAVRNAERLKQAVKEYERKTQTTTERLADTSHGLEAAQNNVLDNTIQANLQSVRAPASGQVISVAGVAQNVGVGEPVITIGKSGRLEVQFSDQSGVWKFLKEKAVLPAVVRIGNDNSSAPGIPAPAPGMPVPVPGMAPGGHAATSPKASEVPVMVRLDEIEAPSSQNAPARLQGIVFDPTAAGKKQAGRPNFRAGMEVVCSIAKPGSKKALSVPRNALMPAPSAASDIAPQPGTPSSPADMTSQNFLIAVLVPLTEAQVQPVAGTSGAPAASTAAGQSYRVEWRPVQLGRGDGVQQEIVAGLKAGERIALQPEELYEWTQNHGSNMTVRLENA